MGKMQVPVTHCTVCGAPGYIIQVAERKCGRLVHGKRCEGINQSALQERDWVGCSKCAASGFDGKRYCLECNGCGWLFCAQEKH